MTNGPIAELHNRIIALDLERATLLQRAQKAEAALRSGWVIERADSDSSAPMYWCGGPPHVASPEPADRAAAWTSNHLHAIRFAREVDARRVAERAMTQVVVRIAEHEWET